MMTNEMFLVRWSHLQSEDVSGNMNNTEGDSLIAVCVLMSGIIAARFGLWITDLTINQILQERVEEERRGNIFLWEWKSCEVMQRISMLQGSSTECRTL